MRSRVWLFRTLAAVLVPAALLAGLEGVLRLAGFGRPATFLIPDERPGYVRTNPDFMASFMPGSFDLRPLNERLARRKPPGTLRVVLLGESAAQGIPVPAFGFGAQLRAQLRARFPGRRIELLNTGIVAINSHVIRSIARDTAGLDPDLYVIYMGNNEVVGPDGPGSAYLADMPPRWLIHLSTAVRASRTGQWLGRLLARLRPARGRSPEWGGMSMFTGHGVRGDDPRLASVDANFAANLRDILATAGRGGAKVVLCTVVSNLKDCAPFLSQHGPGLSAAQLREWDQAHQAGLIQYLIGSEATAEHQLERAREIDPQYADTAYLLGQMALDRGEVADARADFLAAQHWDALRFRPDEPINAIIRQLAADAGPSVKLVDLARDLGSDRASTGPISGHEILFEHVHFDWPGNVAVARAMADAAADLLGGGGRDLDLDQIAGAVGYCAYEREHVLEQVGAIVTHAPFTSQVTYPLDQARYAHSLSQVQAVARDPAVVRDAVRRLRAAVAADPENADLLTLLEDADDKSGDLNAALADARAAASLQPYSFALPTDQAIKLTRLGRTAEAEELLVRTAARGSARDRALMAPAFADLFLREHRPDAGRRYFAEAIRDRPGDLSLELLRARFERMAGDGASADSDFRSILAVHPANETALDGLLACLDDLGRSADGDRTALQFSASQTDNRNNDLRCAVLYDHRGDAANETRCLLAAEHCGPVTSGVEIKLTHNLFAENQPEAAFLHLGWARQLAQLEGEVSALSQIDSVIARISSQHQ
ncbi:MAG TPA: hypothetical protein VGL42_08455 [Opitutaceae bacterium]